MTAKDIVDLLGLAPHPEGGSFCETFRDEPGPGGRSASTAIYYLLEAGQRSHWHRVDAVETWHYYAGAPIAISISADGHDVQEVTLGPDLAAGRAPAGHCPDIWLAIGNEPRRVDIGRLHRRARLQFLGLRNGSAGLDAGRPEGLSAAAPKVALGAALAMNSVRGGAPPHAHAIGSRLLRWHFPAH